jgi:hypothetical protein
MPAHADFTWTIQTVDPNTPFGVGTIAVDSNNNPHVAYTHREGKNAVSYVTYASWNGTSWQNKRITEGGVLDLKLDSNNNPYVLYTADGYYAGSSALFCASWADQEWQIQVVTQNFGGMSASLALDSNKNPHVIYRRALQGGIPANTATLYYAVLDGPQPRVMTVDSPISYSDPVHLALDSNDNPHITYGVDNPSVDGNTGSQTLKYATLNASGWNIQTVFTDIEDYGNMVLDSHGYPHFTYFRSNPPHSNLGNNLTIASWNGSNWNSQTVLSNISSGRIYLALDSHDYPSIDYMAPNPYAQQHLPNPEGNHDYLMYARWTGIQWDKQIVGPNNTAYQEGPIAIDSNGNPHITYAGTPVSPYHATCMYATTTLESTPTSNPTLTPAYEFLWIAIPIVTIATAVAIVYLWKTGKISHQLKTARLIASSCYMVLLVNWL